MPPQRVDPLHPLGQRAGGQVAFPGPGAGQLHHLVVAVRQVQAEAHGPVQLDGGGAADLGMAGQGRQPGEDRVEQPDRDPRQRVGQGDRQGVGFLRLLHIGGGQALDGRLARRDSMALVLQVQQAAAVRHTGVQRGQTHVAGAADRVLLPDMLQRVGGVRLKAAGGHRAGGRFEQAVEVRAVVQRPAAVQLAQVAAGQHLEDVAEPVVEQMEGPALRVEQDGHRGFLSVWRRSRAFYLINQTCRKIR